MALSKASDEILDDEAPDMQPDSPLIAAVQPSPGGGNDARGSSSTPSHQMSPSRPPIVQSPSKSALAMRRGMGSNSAQTSGAARALALSEVVPEIEMRHAPHTPHAPQQAGLSSNPAVAPAAVCSPAFSERSDDSFGELMTPGGTRRRPSAFAGGDDIGRFGASYMDAHPHGYAGSRNGSFCYNYCWYCCCCCHRRWNRRRHRGRRALHPNSPQLRFWNLSSFLVATVVCIITPLVVAFSPVPQWVGYSSTSSSSSSSSSLDGGYSDSYNGNDDGSYISWLWFERFADLVHVIDVVLRCVTAVRRHSDDDMDLLMEDDEEGEESDEDGGGDGGDNKSEDSSPGHHGHHGRRRHHHGSKRKPAAAAAPAAAATIAVMADAADADEEHLDFRPRRILWTYARRWLLPDLVMATPVVLSEVSVLNVAAEARLVGRLLRMGRCLCAAFRIHTTAEALDDGAGDGIRIGFSLLTTSWCFRRGCCCCSCWSTRRRGRGRGRRPDDGSGADLHSSLRRNKVLRWVRIVFLMVICWHILGGFYWGLARRAGFGTGQWAPPAEYLDLPAASQYWLMVLWAVSTTMGEGRDADDGAQAAFTVLTLVAGMLLYTWIVASASSLVVSRDSASTRLLAKLEGLAGFMRTRRIDRHVRQRVLSYYRYLYEARSGTQRDMADFFGELPPHLATEMQVSLHRSLIRQVPLFQRCEEACIATLVRHFRFVVFLPGDFVIRQGEAGETMYFINKGEAEVLVRSSSNNNDDDDDKNHPAGNGGSGGRGGSGSHRRRGGGGGRGARRTRIKSLGVGDFFGEGALLQQAAPNLPLTSRGGSAGIGSGNSNGHGNGSSSAATAATGGGAGGGGGGSGAGAGAGAGGGGCGRRSADVRAVTFCDLSVLHRDDFLAAAAEFPSLRRHVTKVAKNRRRRSGELLGASSKALRSIGADTADGDENRHPRGGGGAGSGRGPPGGGSSSERRRRNSAPSRPHGPKGSSFLV